MKKIRNLHLWIGLITSILILVESITGLLLSEPWLLGGSSMEHRGMPASGFTQQQAQGKQSTQGTQTDQATATAPNGDAAGSQQSATPAAGSQGFRGEGGAPGEKGGTGLAGFIRQLHEGRIGGTDLKIFADITALSMIFLTTTGIYLSYRVLRAQRIARSKKAL